MIITTIVGIIADAKDVKRKSEIEGFDQYFVLIDSKSQRNILIVQ